MRTRVVSRLICAGLLAAAALGGATARAEVPPERLVFHPNLKTGVRPTLEYPRALGVAAELQAPTPVWTRSGLWASRPEKLWGLSQVEAAGQPVWDPSTDTWYAWAMGALVEVKPDGSLPVVLADLPGHDFDIRAAAGLVVYLDPNREEIVLQKLGPSGERRVLIAGERFFAPRFSPDGKHVVVSESRSQGGHLWLVPVAGGQARDLGRGNEPAWHPDSRQLFFTTFTNDGLRHTSSNLFVRDVRTGVQRQLASSTERILSRPTLSPDGTAIAFFEERSGDVVVSLVPQQEGR